MSKEHKMNDISELKTEFLFDENAFDTLEPEWDLLLATTEGTSFQSFGWISKWWKYFGKHPRRSIHLIAFRKNGKLVCIAPFYEGVSKLAGIRFQRRLRLMGDGTGFNETFGFYDNYGRSDFLDIICDPEHASEVASALCGLLLSDVYAAGFDAFSATHVNDRSFIVRHLLPEFEKRKVHFSKTQTDICPSIELPDRFDDFLMSLSSNTRRRLRQSLKAIGQEEGFELIEIDNEDELGENLRILEEMHQSRWNSMGYTGAFLDKRFGPFLNEYVKDAFHRGQIMFVKATDSSGICATRLCLTMNGRVLDYMSGFNYEAPSAKYRPGIGTLTVMIREAIESQKESFELLRGDEGYKFDLTSKVYKNWHFYTALGNRETLRSKIIGLLSFIYYTIDKEKNLIEVQVILHGPLFALPKYLVKRIELLKNKA